MDIELKELIKQSQRLSEDAVIIYKDIVEDLIISEVKDNNQIELTLDYMLPFCNNNDMLLLYRKLCRYYFYINPEATVDYINMYREMWD